MKEKFWTKNIFSKVAGVMWVTCLVFLLVFVVLMISATDSYAVAATATIFGLLFVLVMFGALMFTVVGSRKGAN